MICRRNNERREHVSIRQTTSQFLTQRAEQTPTNAADNLGFLRFPQFAAPDKWYQSFEKVNNRGVSVFRGFSFLGLFSALAVYLCRLRIGL